MYTCGCAGIPEGDCDRDGNQTDALEFAVDRAQQTQTWMAFATTSTNVLVHSTHATCVTAQAKSSSVAAPTSPLEIAIVMETNRRFGRVWRGLR